MDLDFEDPVMTPQELLVLRSIAIVAASISLTSGLLVGYWFIRMKRSFRHQYVNLSHPKRTHRNFVFQLRDAVLSCAFLNIR